MDIGRDMARRQQRQILQAAEESNQSWWDDFEQKQAEARAEADFNPTLFQDGRGGLRFANWNDLRSAI